MDGFPCCHCDHDEALTASVMIWLIVSSSLWVIGCYRYDCSSVQMLIECTKLLTGAPQARRFAAMCTSGFGHRAQYPFNEALLATLRVSDEAGIGICTKDGLRHQCSLEITEQKILYLMLVAGLAANAALVTYPIFVAGVVDVHTDMTMTG